ncbi:MAG: hypothetical protein MST03_09235 [Bacteroidales bacterium]|nr:hypothetical protein [Bacteroidales bacterium]
MNTKIKVLIATIVSLLITIGSYFLNNCPYPFWDNLSWICWEEYGIRHIRQGSDNLDDVFFVNLSNDKEVVEVPISFGLRGKEVITDRKVLLDFLKMAEGTNYKYIFLDILFPKGVCDPEVDSCLISQILSMPNVYFSAEKDGNVLDPLLSSRGLRNNYYTSIVSTNFTRYQFVQEGQASAPLHLYSLISGDTIKQFGSFFVSKRHLCYNSPMLVIPRDFYEQPNDILEDKFEVDPIFYNFGPYLNKFGKQDVREELHNSMNGKTVFVGDFVNDVHDTYVGLQPGPWILYLAYNELKNEQHIVSWWYLLFGFLLYFVLAMFLLCDFNLVDVLCSYRFFQKHRLFLFLVSLVSFEFVLFVIGIISYLAWGFVYNTFIPSITLSVLTLLLSYKKINKV